ncbi:rab5 GDP/GTP exchange factor-like isoform X1 [Varroa destructor]|uniref:Rab5 GDP/GTP exchange factor n=1 Tax=Varroa destructor TaxID=109461 RepID=A0A7M7K240_VARDE|nr:rab5 GDP/GTP exchange factor-like isoform X1 [Varroa destructor]
MSSARRATLLHVEDRDVYCRNGCQFYGNPEWEGFCSKCYKLIRQQQQQQLQQHTKNKVTSAKIQLSRQSLSDAKPGGTGDFFGRFEEKKNRQKEQQRGSKTLKNFIKRANTLKENTSFSLGSSWNGPILRDKKASDGLLALREVLHGRLALRQEICVEIIKLLNGAFERMETLFKKNESMSTVSDMIQDVYQLIYDRAAEEVEASTAQEAVELCEDFFISHTYDILFSVLSSEEERRDLKVLQRIRSLHWVRANHLELDVDDIHPTVKEFMDEAMKQLIFIDSKRSPKEKLACVVDAAKNIFKMLQAAPKGPSHAGADDFLPAMIYVVLRANPPRLHTNIKLVTLFSAQSRLRSGESGYMFTNLCGAVNFIETLTADKLQMPQKEFEAYIQGKAMPMEDSMTAGARLMYHNMAALKELHLRQDRLADASEQLKMTLDSLQKDIAEQVQRALAESEDATKPHEYRVSKSIPTRCLPTFMRDKVLLIEPPASPPQPADLPPPLQPELLHQISNAEDNIIDSNENAADNHSNVDNINNNSHSTSSRLANTATSTSTDEELVTAGDQTIAATPDSDLSADEVLQVELTCSNGESPEGQDVPQRESASDPAESEPA